jgi:hypothetical protein
MCQSATTMPPDTSFLWRILARCRSLWSATEVPITKQKTIMKKIIAGIVVFTALSGCVDMADIEKKVCSDAIEQYEIAVRQGDKIQIAVQAGFVSAAMLQAKDEEGYREWKAVQDRAEKDAGLRF